MSPIMIGIIGFLILFAILALGMPIGLGMATIGFIGMLFFLPGSAVLAKLAATPFANISSYDLSVLPLFLLMANITFSSGISGQLFNLANKWLGHNRGGAAMATVGACAGFAAVSASSIATAATMGLMAIPEMKRLKYDMRLATGSVAAGGTIGILIPPSSLLILYGILTETSIGKLFLAGFIPGLLEAVFYVITIYILCRINPTLGPRGPKTTFKEKLMAFRGCGEMAGLIFLVLGGLILGWFTPTEAGAVGSFGAIFFSLIRKQLNWPKFKHAVIETMKITGMVYTIVIGAFIFNHFLTMSTIPRQLANFVSGLEIPVLLTVLLIILVYMFLGCIVDAFAMLMLTIPVFFPMAQALGIDLLWFGILITRIMEMAMITPPVGMNVYVIAGVAPDVPIQDIFKGILPFFLADIVHVSLLVFVPSVALFLPNLI
ncbi:MAG: TRAP transporter large permease [Deltaproteobacteria bacterium]|nr:TRAP transporter large permease [Deltaproteobacteria bacterium]